MYGDGIVVPVAQAFIEAVKEVVGKARMVGVRRIAEMDAGDCGGAEIGVGR